MYISDSPVHDDNIEYNYVSSDVEEDLNKSEKIVKRVKTPGLPTMQKRKENTNNTVIDKKGSRTNSVTEPPQELSEEDELAKEAQYQRELQDRLQNTSLEAEGER